MLPQVPEGESLPRSTLAEVALRPVQQRQQVRQPVLRQLALQELHIPPGIAFAADSRAFRGKPVACNPADIAAGTAVDIPSAEDTPWGASGNPAVGILEYIQQDSPQAFAEILVVLADILETVLGLCREQWRCHQPDLSKCPPLASMAA